MSRIKVACGAISGAAGVVFLAAHLAVALGWVSFEGPVRVGPGRVENAMLAPVREYFRLRIAGTYGDVGRETANYQLATARYLSQRARDQLGDRLAGAQMAAGRPEAPDLVTAFSRDRLEWTNLVDLPAAFGVEKATLHLGVKSTTADDIFSLNFTLSEAKIGVSGGDTPVLIRRAVGGCRVLDGDFTVIPLKFI